MSDPAPTVRPMSAATQLTFDDLGPALNQVTFVVVDLETDGGSPVGAGITEIGAVKVRGGEVVGQFQTLVHLGRPLAPFIRALTGITDDMLLGAPPCPPHSRPSWSSPAVRVLVAHNAPYDVSFLKGACVRLGSPWPDPPVLDTARLARHVLTRDEVPNCKLGTLARHFRTEVTPNHRALADAQATVDVLHGLMERVGNLGVHTLTELQGYSSRVPDARRRKRGLADGLPDGPGVYVFEDSQGVALYVGTSRSDPQEGPELLHRRRAAPPDDRDGRARVEGGGRALRDPARGAGARAAHDRRPCPAVQPTIDPTAERRLAQAHSREVPPGQRGEQGP